MGVPDRLALYEHKYVLLLRLIMWALKLYLVLNTLIELLVLEAE